MMPRPRRCAVALALLVCALAGSSALLTSPSAPAQQEKDRVYKKLSVDDLQRILQQDIVKEMAGPPGKQQPQYFLRLGKQRVQVVLLANDAILLLRCALEQRITLDAVNLWNDKQAVQNRAFRSALGNAVLETDLNCQFGTSAAAVRQFVENFRGSLEVFTKFAQKFGGALVRSELPVKFLDAAQTKLEVTFPLGRPDWHTAWKIEWGIERRDVPAALRREGVTQVKKNEYFHLKGAWFKPAPAEEWIQVLNDARVSEIFVPYNDGKVRWYDVLDHGKHWEIKNEAVEAGPRGRVLGKERLVVGEARDRGILYKNTDGQARRGEEFALWANLNAGNYNYFIQYAFQDDGTITFRLGATGKNLHLPPQDKKQKPLDYPRMGHMHNACWRINFRLGPKDNTANNVLLVSHHEKKTGNGVADQVPELFNGGFEGYADWRTQEFTRLRVENPNVTAGRNRNPISYDLIPAGLGVARHYGTAPRSEKFAEHDFWVTREDSNHFYYITLPEYFARLGAKKERPRITNTHPVLWVMTSVLHEPRAEDGLAPGHNQEPTGPATTAWSGFDLRPRNVFTTTPLFPPSR